MTDLQRRILDRTVIVLAVAVVVAIIGFVTYYILDRQGGDNASALEHEIAQYEQAVLDDPTDMGARMALAELYYADQRYAESAEQFRVVLAVNEESVLAMVGLGRALLASGDQEGAISSFQQVIDASRDVDVPGDLVETAHYYMASILLDQQRPGEAIDHLNQALAIERTDADAWHLLGAAYLENGDLDDAISALSQAVSFVPDFAEAYEKLVVAYERKGLTAESRYARGMLAFSQERYSDAEADLAAALDASPTLVDAHVGLGLVRESQGQRELAVSSYQQALHLDPDNFNAQAGLARLGVTTPESAAEEGVAP